MFKTFFWAKNQNFFSQNKIGNYFFEKNSKIVFCCNKNFCPRKNIKNFFFSAKTMELFLKIFFLVIETFFPKKDGELFFEKNSILFSQKKIESYFFPEIETFFENIMNFLFQKILEFIFRPKHRNFFPHKNMGNVIPKKLHIFFFKITLFSKNRL
jgi:hypothetical protein